VKLDWAILANAAEVQNNLIFVLGGGWDTGTRPLYPAPFQGALAMRLLLHPTEMSRPHKVEIQLNDEDGQPIAPIIGLNTNPGPPPPNHPTGWDVAALVVVGMQSLMIPKPGGYSLEILLDDQHFRTIPFRFVQVTAPGTPPSH
jgi:hypothetical protein